MRRSSSGSYLLGKGQLLLAIGAIVVAGLAWPAIASPLHQLLEAHNMPALNHSQIPNSSAPAPNILQTKTSPSLAQASATQRTNHSGSPLSTSSPGGLAAEMPADKGQGSVRALGPETSRGGQRAPVPTPTAIPPAPVVKAAAVVPSQVKAPKPTVVIDPGHGGPDTGATRVFPDGFDMRESDLTLKVSLLLADLLRGEGYHVLLTRQSDVSPNTPPRDRTADGRISLADDLQARIDVANNAKADLFVSIHFNAASDQQGGTEVFYDADRPFSDKSKQMAEFLQNDLLKAIQSVGYTSPDRGVKRDVQSGAGTYLYVLGPKTNIIYNPIAMPSVLGEALFISNDTEGTLLRSEKTLQAIAGGYQNAIDQYFAWLGK